jgi:hypothetical protein
LMVAGQSGQFLVDHDTVINVIWSASDNVEQIRTFLSDIERQ